MKGLQDCDGGTKLNRVNLIDKLLRTRRLGRLPCHAIIADSTYTGRVVRWMAWLRLRRLPRDLVVKWFVMVLYDCRSSCRLVSSPRRICHPPAFRTLPPAAPVTRGKRWPSHARHTMAKSKAAALLTSLRQMRGTLAIK